MRRILFVLIAMICSFFSGCGVFGAPKFYDKTPVSYEYTYSGTMAHPIDWYSVKTEEGSVIISYSHHSPEITVIKAPDDLLEKIGAIARDAKLFKLKPGYRPKLHVLDGYGWDMLIRYPEDYISSGGSNAWPSGKLRGGIKAINQLIKDVIESTPEEAILRHEMR